MTTQVRFLASVSASAFHTLDRLARGLSVVDGQLEETLRPAVGMAAEALKLHHWRLPELLAHVIPPAATVGPNLELAEFALRKTFGPPVDPWLSHRLAEIFGYVEAAMIHHAPNLVDELELRSQPLRELWEARGPGLLAAVRRFTEDSLVVERADAILVRPAGQGGGGAAHVPYNSVRIEAVLANPHADLPEVLRLGWLIGQLNADLPRYQGEMRFDRAVAAMSLAMVPVTLAAGEEVELGRCELAAVERAVSAWEVVESRPAGPDIEPERSQPIASSTLAELVWRWWTIYRESRPSWPVALAALGRMLEEPA